jgi:hypothetical protein
MEDMVNSQDRHKQFYYECREHIGIAVAQMCQRYALKKYKISIDSESTVEEYNNYKLMKVSIEWSEYADRYSLTRIINMHEIRESPIRQEIINCHVRILDQQIKNHLNKTHDYRNT